jgi:hypothetical protein
MNTGLIYGHIDDKEYMTLTGIISSGSYSLYVIQRHSCKLHESYVYLLLPPILALFLWNFQTFLLALVCKQITLIKGMMQCMFELNARGDWLRSSIFVMDYVSGWTINKT